MTIMFNILNLNWDSTFLDLECNFRLLLYVYIRTQENFIKNYIRYNKIKGIFFLLLCPGKIILNTY